MLCASCVAAVFAGVCVQVQTLTEATRRVSCVAADVFASRFIQRQLQRRDSGGESDGITLSKKLLNRAAMAGRFFKM